MKKVLIGMIVLDIIVGAVVFFATLATNLFLAVLSLFSTVLGLVPLLALIGCMEQIENLQVDFRELHAKLYVHLRDSSEENLSTEGQVFTDHATRMEPPKQTANRRWLCAKCKSVNKEGSTACENCGAHYSSQQGFVPEMPVTKWRLKEKKKKSL